MYKINSRSAFTLMEIIVVMIILGIVAAIALPNVFGQIERNRAQEAVSNMSAIRQQVDSCIAANGGSSFGCSFTTTDSPNYDYVIAGLDATGATTGGATITATRDKNTGGAVAPTPATGTTNTVVLTRASGAWSCAGTGVYSGVCR